MGITSFSITLLQQALPEAVLHDRMTVIELGAQNMYDKEYPDGIPYADEWYKAHGACFYFCIDLSGENGALMIDLSQPMPKKFEHGCDILTDFGTSEHIGTNGKFDWKASYNCWKTKHDLLARNGIMVSENPLTGNWPGHGFAYYTEDFYRQLAEANGYEIISLGTHPAMGNDVDGWNVYCILRKPADDRPFMKLTQFKKLDLRQA